MSIHGTPGAAVERVCPYGPQKTRQQQDSLLSSSQHSAVTAAWRADRPCSEASSLACPDAVYARDQDPGIGGSGGSGDPCGDAPPGGALLCAETDLFTAAAIHPHQQQRYHQQQAVPGRGLDLETMIGSHCARESALRPNPRYLDAPPPGAPPPPGDALTPQMRTIVVSWMVEVCDEFSLQPETLHLAVSLLDRFLSSAVPQGVPRGVLQLVAVACIMVAAKDLEVNHPSVKQLTAIAANCFTAQDLLRMERVLLDALDFNIAPVTAFSFLHLFAQGLSGIGPPVAALAVYLLELVLLDYSLLEFPPSQLAAGALILSMHTHDQTALLGCLLRLSGYDLPSMAPCVASLLQLHQNASWPQTQTVRDLLAPLVSKYSQQPWCCAALARPLVALQLRWPACCGEAA